MKTIRLLLVDDSPAFIDSAGKFISAFPNVEIVGIAMSGNDALKQVFELRPDVVLMDLVMPQMNGLEVTRQIKSFAAAPHVVIVTLHDHPEYRKAAEAVGADGFLVKSNLVGELQPTLAKLMGSHEAGVPAYDDDFDRG